MTVTPDPFNEFSAEQLQARLFPRVLPSTSDACVGALQRTVVNLDGAPGLVEVLVLDLDDALYFLSAPDVDRLGGQEAVRARAYANLRGLQLPDAETVTLDGHGDFHVIASESVHNASLLLTPERVTEHAASTNGVLMVAPNRHTLAWHNIQDASVLPTLNALSAYAREHSREAEYVVSPDVLWVHEGHIDALTSTPVGGSVEVRVPAGFERVLSAISL